MEEKRVVIYSSGRIAIDSIAKLSGLIVVLVNEKDLPLARYSFDPNKIKHKDQIEYSANNYKIDFEVVPTVIFENMPS